MNIEAIVLGVNRLYDNYAPETSKASKDNKIQFLNRELSGYSSYQFDKAVCAIVSDENIKRFPTLAQIKNHMPRTVEKDMENTKYCTKCEGTGYYSVWQYKTGINKHYSFPYRCRCNNTFMQHIPLIDPSAIPVRAHNGYPPNDIRHKEFNNRIEVEY